MLRKLIEDYTQARVDLELAIIAGTSADIDVAQQEFDTMTKKLDAGLMELASKCITREEN